MRLSHISAVPGLGGNYHMSSLQDEGIQGSDNNLCRDWL